MLTTLLIAALLQTQPAPGGRSLVLRSGDAVVVGPGTNARIVFSRRADVRIAKGAVPTEVVILIDHETGDGPPDGAVDRVFRHELVEPLPDAYVYRGPAVIEEVQLVADGAAGRPTRMTIVTPAGRLGFGSASDTAEPDDITIRTTGSRGATLVPGSYNGRRSFADVEQIWVSRQEDSQTRVGVSLGMTGGSHAAGPVTSWRIVPDAQAAQGITPARVLKSVPAVYSSEAVRRGAEGTVRLEITVIEDGSVSDVKLLSTADAELDRAAVDAARQWRFRPAREGDRAIPATVTVDISFTAKGAVPRF